MLLYYFVFGLLLNNVLCAENKLNVTPVDDGDSYYPPVEWSDIFDWKLIKVLSSKAKNILVSPISLKIVLGVLYDGASGSTQREFESGLQFFAKEERRTQIRETLNSLQVDPSSANKLQISTRLFLESTIKPKEKYSRIVKEYYGGDIVGANFSNPKVASDLINNWVDLATQGTIPTMVDEDDLQDMIMLVANAVFFKGVWRHQFPKNETCVRGFYVDPDTVRYTPFMSTTDSFFYMESEYLDAKIIRLPYKNSEFSMFILLPRAKGGLQRLIQNINLYDLHRQLHYMNQVTVQVSLPKFEFNFKASYNKILQQFGLRKMFQNTASFTGITQGNSTLLRQLVVSDIIQSAGIKVDEEGSIAYAATEVIIGNKIGIPDATFNASHPFLFFVQEETNGTIIFIGKFESPMEFETEIKKEVEIDTNDFPVTEKLTPVVV